MTYQSAEWRERYTSLVIDQITWHRHRAGLTVAELATRCDALGRRIGPTVIVDLERKRRKYVSVDELLVIAQALEVPPLMLMLPIGLASGVEALPGERMDIASAIDWLRGDRPPPGAPRTEMWHAMAAYLRALAYSPIAADEEAFRADQFKEVERIMAESSSRNASERAELERYGLRPPPIVISVQPPGSQHEPSDQPQRPEED